VNVKYRLLNKYNLKTAQNSFSIEDEVNIKAAKVNLIGSTPPFPSTPCLNDSNINPNFLNLRV
jgi:hypothetical protein